MFDTSLVRPRAVAAPRRYALLSISFAIHSAVAVAVVVTGVATVEFPPAAPDQMELLRPVMAVSLPPALGPGGPAKRAPQVTPPPKQQPPREITAPDSVPDETPVADPLPTTGATDASDAGTGEEGPVGGGDPLGVAGGVGDDPAGSLIGTPDGSGPLVPGGEVRGAKVLRRVEPRYPQSMIAARIRTAVVTVRCVIDRNGRVRNPEVLMSSFPPFNAAVIDALEQWTFAPGTLRGQPVETWFELTVKFEVR
jgi:protein TonB